MSYLLPENAKIALVCTGSVCKSVKEVRQAVHYLFDKYAIRTCYGQETYLPLPAKTRAEIFKRYLFDESIDVIWSLRGGEGSADLIPFLTPLASKIRKLRPKLLLGFSDFTPILVYFQQNFNWPVMHGPAARQLPLRQINLESEKRCVNYMRSGRLEAIDDLVALNHAAQQEASLSAIVTGGNLTLVHISLQDIWQVKPAGKILLLEEVNEQPYKVGRTLKHLQRIGFFNQAKAIVFAGFDFPSMSVCDNKLMQIKIHRVLQEFACSCNLPVLFTNQVGHGLKNKLVPFFQPALLTLGKIASLQFAT